MKKIVTYVMSFLFFLPTSQGLAIEYDICKAKALKDIEYIDTKQPIAKGEILEAVSQYHETQSGGKFFCQHGGGCFPAYITVNDREVKAATLINCKIGKPLEDSESTEDNKSYALLPLRSKFKSTDDLTDLSGWVNDQLEYGAELCTGCREGNADKPEACTDICEKLVNAYLKAPRSECGKLAEKIAEDPQSYKTQYNTDAEKQDLLDKAACQKY